MLEPTHAAAPESATGDALRTSLLVLGLVAAVAVVYRQVGGFGFVNLDDGTYVYQNALVKAGLTWEGLAWAFGFHAANWHPLTWLSHMLDVQLFGLDPGWHHLVNLGLHLVNAALLFLLLQRATGATWRSAFAAALFGLHPLHVESVAWISERKDLLSTLFWLLTTLAWLGYVRRPSPARYATAAVWFALGLMSKPMLVTLPLVLLLLDVWPLGRLGPDAVTLRTLAPLVREKLPLLGLSAISSVITYLAQGSAVSALVLLPLPVRATNAVLSCVAYLRQTVWPTGLAALYPHPGLLAGGIGGLEVAAGGAVLAGLSALAWWQRRRRPWLLIGWAWFLVTLVPVIGLVQVGIQGRADRYTYLPLIGLFIALAWAIPAPAPSARGWRLALAAAAGLVLVPLGALASRQVATWRDSVTLFDHALAVTQDNYQAWRNLGTAYTDAGRQPEAILALRESVRLMPQDADAWMNLAIAHSRARQFAEAAACFEQAVGRRPDDPVIWYNLGLAAALQGRWERVAEAQERLRQLDPRMAGELARKLERIRGQP